MLLRQKNQLFIRDLPFFGIQEYFPAATIAEVMRQHAGEPETRTGSEDASARP